MNTYNIFIYLFVICLGACSGNNLDEKGFSVSEAEEADNNEHANGFHKDSLKFATRPVGILLTADKEHRLTPVYKVNYNKRDNSTFTGSNNFHYNYSEISELPGNVWHGHYLPGYDVVYGYNFVNISHYNTKTRLSGKFFEKPVLIKSLYFPAFLKDSLNFQPVHRKHYLVSVYDEDTNKDGMINRSDLRRFYAFDINAQNRSLIIPKNQSVVSAEYDPDNDHLYVFTRADQNNNGTIDELEDVHVFWIDLNDPLKSGVVY